MKSKRGIRWPSGVSVASTASAAAAIALLLCGASSGPPREPRVTVRTVIAPELPRPAIDGWPDRATEQQRADAAAEEQNAWAAALQSDPEVRAFMSPRP